jgi:acetyltransferase
MIDVSSGYELILGSSPDQQFGPVLLFGSGGSLVEILGDQALSLPPLTTTLARRMMERTRIYRALVGKNDQKAADVERLERVLVRFSQLVAEQRLIREIEINPLVAMPRQEGRRQTLLALDARVLLYGPEVDERTLPKLAIRPYPIRYAAPYTLTTGVEVTIRPIRPEDEPLMAHFNSTLSEASVYLRYFHPKTLSQRISHDELTRVCFIDYDREMALVADRVDPRTGRSEIIGMGQLTRQHGVNASEYAILINDDYQRTGLGTELLRRLLEIAKAEGIEKVTADMLPENSGMRRVSQKLGFKLERDFDEGIVKAEILL